MLSPPPKSTPSHRPATRPDARPDARIVKSRDALKAALIALVAEMPFEEVTVAAITQRAGIGYATFFRHYPTREALLAEIADGLIAELAALVVPSMLANDADGAARALTGFVVDRQALCRGLLVGAGDALRRDIIARASAVAEAADTRLPDWLPRDLAVVHGVGATLSILRWWLESDQRGDASAIATVIARLVFGPMAPATQKDRDR